MENAVARSFRADPASLGEIRSFIRARVLEAGMEPIADDLVLATSEAAGNVVLHAGSEEIVVEWRRERDAAVVTVIDRGTFKRHPLTPISENGRGIFLMTALTDDVTILEGDEKRPGTIVTLSKRFRPGEEANGRAVARLAHS